MNNLRLKTNPAHDQGQSSHEILSDEDTKIHNKRHYKMVVGPMHKNYNFWFTLHKRNILKYFKVTGDGGT